MNNSELLEKNKASQRPTITLDDAVKQLEESIVFDGEFYIHENSRTFVNKSKEELARDYFIIKGYNVI